MEEKAKPSKRRRGKIRVPQSSKGHVVLNSASLPECFHSGESNSEEFWGFPVDFAHQTIDGDYSIQYVTNNKADFLFNHDQEDSQEEFNGFTRLQMCVCQGSQ